MSNTKTSQPRTPTNKMLIDATHPEETRVVVLRENRVEEFDYESAARKLLRGNIYLAKVTRVEPSLQAAFVDYGGNRHGFLAFNEIHPDYYQIPIADRVALLEAEAAEEAEAAALADAEAEARAEPEASEGEIRRPEQDDPEPNSPALEESAIDVVHLLPSEPVHTTADTVVHEADAEFARDRTTATSTSSKAADAGVDPVKRANRSPEDDDTSSSHATSDVDLGSAPQTTETDYHGSADTSDTVDDSSSPHSVGLVEDEGVTEIESEENGAPEIIEEVTSVANEDALEELPSRPRRRQRSYKIQEVIKRKQVILVQVVKEERGTKGAALTTYLSLAGRYTVLMPNTARGGGISRKITNPQDRKRLKAIAEELDVPYGMGLIIRTAGASRTKQEIRRDFEYLLRLWESVRELTLQSTAPALVYEEGNLIKRSIRDLYGKEVDEIIVAGDPAFREAKDFMRMLMPSHVKNVLQHTDAEPLFTTYQIERQLNAMFSPYVHLRSGGYLVINQTEALVAIDVNSGKATREFSIEETALNTNIEAADEVARQLKLRDLAGLIVVDFIDMEEKRNNRAVERRLKDALRHDRARIQVGHISHFGLLEMSRQRMRTGVLEGSTSQCPHCQGTGIIRSTESVALGVLRALEDALTNSRPVPLAAHTTANVALYLLNNKRQFIIDIERRYGVPITVLASDKHEGSDYSIEQIASRGEGGHSSASTAISMDWGFNAEENREAGSDSEAQDSADNRKRGRRRRRRGRSDDNGTHRTSDRTKDVRQGSYDDQNDITAFHDQPDNDTENDEVSEHGSINEDPTTTSASTEADAVRNRRRGRRGGRRNRRGRGGMGQNQSVHAFEGEEVSAETIEHLNGHAHDFSEQLSSPPSGATDYADDRMTEEPLESAPEPIARDTIVDFAVTRIAAVAQLDPKTTDEQHPNSEISAVSANSSSGTYQEESTPIRPETDATSIDVVQMEPSKPTLERIIVTPENTHMEPQPAAPARRGWWQRK